MRAAQRLLIVHTDQPFDPAGINSGAENATCEHARILARAGWEVVVAATLRGGPRRIGSVYFHDLGPEYDVAGAVRLMARGGDFSLLSEGKSIALFFGREEERCKRRILVSHDRSLHDTGARPAVLESLAHRVVCVSEAQRAVLTRDGLSPAVVEVLHNGVSEERFCELAGKVRHPQRLVFVGALVPDKGLHLLINVFPSLKARFPDLELDVFGDAGLWGRENYFDPRAVEAAEPSIRFHGRVAQDRLCRAYNESTICVIPSIWFDPFPLTSLEAQSCGCPVVTFDVGGLAEGLIDGVTGLVAREVSEAALAEHIRALLADPERLHAMSRNAVQHVRHRHSWLRVGERLEALLAYESPSCAHVAELFG
jgi:glycosyltransferase involved in cell wall biosynthesis